MSVNEYSQLYLPVALRKAVRIQDSVKGNVEGIADTRSVLIFPEGMSAEEALESLEVIKMHLEHEKKQLAREVQTIEPSSSS